MTIPKDGPGSHACDLAELRVVASRLSEATALLEDANHFAMCDVDDDDLAIWRARYQYFLAYRTPSPPIALAAFEHPGAQEVFNHLQSIRAERVYDGAGVDRGLRYPAAPEPRMRSSYRDAPQLKPGDQCGYWPAAPEPRMTVNGCAPGTCVMSCPGPGNTPHCLYCFKADAPDPRADTPDEGESDLSAAHARIEYETERAESAESRLADAQDLLVKLTSENRQLLLAEAQLAAIREVVHEYFKPRWQGTAASAMARITKALTPAPSPGAGLLQPVNAPLPPGCHCPPGVCHAPRIMGVQMPCRRAPSPGAGETT